MSKKCLIVDDNIETVDIVRHIIAKAGYEVLCAYDGQNGLEMAQIHRPDIILLDIMMPVMDGYTMYKHLKEDATINEIPVIIMTARSGMSPMFQSDKGIPVQGYLIKPFSRNLLLQTIVDALRKPLT